MNGNVHVKEDFKFSYHVLVSLNRHYPTLLAKYFLNNNS